MYLFLNFAIIFLQIFNVKVLVKAHQFEKIIINGVNVWPGEAPYQVFLRQQISGNVWRICGATLFKQNKVLTAAHCVVPNDGDAFIRYGTRDRSIEVYPDVKVNKISRHPKYNETDLLNDLAVLTLEKNIPEDSNVRYVKLETSELTPNDLVIIYGWGKTQSDTLPNILQRAFLNVVSLEPTRIIARGSNTIACQGDSGGVMVSNNGKQCGITSAVEVGCPPGGINVYTKVSAFIDWINSQ